MAGSPIIICPSEEELQSDSQRNIKCLVTGCDKLFSTLPAMWMHSAKTHHVYKDEAFKQAMSSTKKKDRSKSVIKHFFCPMAGCNRGESGNKPFDRLTTLKMHYINQHAEKKFVCERCGSKFGSSSYLDVHVSRCGQMFKCSCGVPYTTPEALYVHAKRQKHELTEEFLKSRKYKWRRKDLEAKAFNKPTVKKRGLVPLLPKPPVFILHQIVCPVKVSTCTQTDGRHLPSYPTPKKKRQSITNEKRLKQPTTKRKRIDRNAEVLSQRHANTGSDHFASQQLQRLASTAETELTNIPYNVIQVISDRQGPVTIQQPPHERNGRAHFANYSRTLSSACNQLTSQSPLHYSSAATDGLSSQGIQSSNLVSVGSSLAGGIPSSSSHGSGCMMTNIGTSAPSSSYQTNVVTVSTGSDPEQAGTVQAASNLLTMATGSNVISTANEPQNALSFANSSTSTESNDSINFRSIGTTFETFGVPTQTDFSFLDLFASCDIQTQTIESIFACSPVNQETSATQTQLQLLRDRAVETIATTTTDAETLVNNMLEEDAHQTSMQTQTLIAEQSTMETQTPSSSTHALNNMRTVELQTMTHSTIATSPCPLPEGEGGLQQETQETQTMKTLSSHDLLSLDIYTQTGLNDVDLSDRTHLDDLEFADIHTQTMDDFDLGVFGMDGNSTSVQTDVPLVSRGEGSHTVGTQVQMETVSADVQTDAHTVRIV
ncbi:putative ATM interactor-like [Apostichopus japonicus]|uniref:Putative ATM interactor-like n=1 Tax=Stichopus japonicus TaxID=307972 RepID=A0A2G8JKU2_STIJA|nr:putative ATM interactor-like [Apostichopus japonicus]